MINIDKTNHFWVCWNWKGAAHLNLRPIESLHLAFARSKIATSVTWDLLCKTLLVCNIADIDHTSALASLLSHYGIKGAAELQCQLLGFRSRLLYLLVFFGLGLCLGLQVSYLSDW